MCKYSFDAIPTRLAMEGEELITHTFLDGSTGFVSPGDAQHCPAPGGKKRSGRGKFRRILDRLRLIAFHTAESAPGIYVPFGTRLILKDVPSEIQRRYRIGCEEGVTFAHLHGRFDFPRDGLRVANNGQIYLRDLPEGTPLEVLSIAGTEFALCGQELEIRGSTMGKSI